MNAEPFQHCLCFFADEQCPLTFVGWRAVFAVCTLSVPLLETGKSASQAPLSLSDESRQEVEGEKELKTVSEGSAIHIQSGPRLLSNQSWRDALAKQCGVLDYAAV